MPKSSDIAGVNPLVRIMPLLSVAAIGDPIQLLDSRATPFARGQNSSLPSSRSLQEITANIGNDNITTASFSPAAYLINNALKQAEVAGIPTKYEAQTAITHTPEIPEVIAHDLKNAINNTGLFYESHLGEFAEGHRSLTEIRQEPQNQLGTAANSLLPQQLNILEHQRLAWHGEVWPGQKMDWDVYLQNEQKSASGSNHQAADNQKTVASDLTLHLPHLGKVTAKLSMVEGRMHISMFAEEAQTLSILKTESKELVNAIVKNGQVLEGLAVGSHA